METIFIDSPAKLLVSLLSETDQSKKIHLISGTSGSGKTLWCTHLFHEARSMGLDVKGLVSLPVFEYDHKVGINLQNLESGSITPLGTKKDSKENHVSIGGWNLYSNTLEWGNRILANIQSCQILIIDELGPLEFNENSGLTKSFELLESGQYSIAFVVVRTGLILKALTKWPSAEIHFIPEREKLT